MVETTLNGSAVTILLLATASGLSTLVGVALVIRFAHTHRGIAIGTGFSVGIMVVISTFDLIPASMKLISPIHAVVSAILGAVLVAICHWVIPHQHLVKEYGLLGARMARTSYLVALGMILHDFPEGFALANVYLAQPSAGLMLALAIALHNVPEGFAIAAPAAQLKRPLILAQVAVAAALAEPIGAMFGLLALSMYPQFDGYLMAAAAGAMVYVSLHELLPMAREHGDMRSFELGMVTSGGVYVVMTWLFKT